MKTFVPPLFLTAAVLALGACSIVAKGKGAIGGDRPDVPSGDDSVAAAPKVEEDDDDSFEVRNAIQRMDEMEKWIPARDWFNYGRESSNLQNQFLVKKVFENEGKGPALKKRLDALDAAAFQSMGGRLQKFVGKGVRVTSGVDADGVEAAEAAIAACEDAAKTTTTGSGDAQSTLATAIDAYEKAAARATKMDKNALRYMGEGKSGSVDVPISLLQCEGQLANLMVAYGDEYVPEKAAETGTERGCGTMEWLADGVQVGSGRFAPYSRTEGGASYIEKADCTKLARKDKYPKELAGAVAEYKERMGVADIVIVAVGKPVVEESENDYRLHRYQRLIAYSKNFEFQLNPCGGDAKLFCEAGGSRGARAYNEQEHHLDRAQIHAGANPDRCKEHLKAAVKGWEWFQDLQKELTQSGKWVTGATYKTKKGAKLKEKAFVASFEANAKRADDRLLAKYCAKPQPAGADKGAADNE